MVICHLAVFSLLIVSYNTYGIQPDEWRKGGEKRNKCKRFFLGIDLGNLDGVLVMCGCCNEIMG